MRFNDAILFRYISQTPLALAFERTLECEIFRPQVFEPPVLDGSCAMNNSPPHPNRLRERF